MLAEISLPQQRTLLFSRYNQVALLSGSLGALAVGLPDVLTHLGLPLEAGIRSLFVLYSLVALSVIAVTLRLSWRVELQSATTDESRERQFVPPLGRSRRIILRLALLFSADALAGGLVVQSLLALFFHLRYDVPLGPLAALFFGANLLSAVSLLAAPPLARRFGLLNTMVFTHLPSNFLLALVPFMPTFALAALVLLARQLLSQMDVPTRQAYTMALVAPEERTATATITSLARSGGSASSPVLAGLLLQGSALTLGLPFILAGIVKSAYDLSLWAIFRQVKVEE
jgi:hypothetical protein